MPRLTLPARPLAALAASLALLQAPAAQAFSLDISRVWQFAHQPVTPGQKSEVVAYDPLSDTLWVAGVVGIDVLRRTDGGLVQHIDLSSFGAVNSVAIHGGLAAFAIENTADRTQAGSVVFYDTATRTQNGAAVAVGALPDMLTFTPDGSRVLVANEGTPTIGQPADPVGSVSIVNVASRTETRVEVTPAIPGHDSLRLFPATAQTAQQPAAFPSYGPEPEYIAVNAAGTRAYVGLQEANGIGVLNLETQSFDKIYSLGLKDFSLPGNEIDPSDQDGKTEFRSATVFGLYQPDTILSFEHQGQTLLVMANEGDAREDGLDERRGQDGNASVEYVPNGSELGRTTLDNVTSRRNGDLIKFGGHSFSIRDVDGHIVYDSGSILDREAAKLGLYDDTRSDNKGVEPEGLALLEIAGRTLAFVGLERTAGAVAVFDITDPAHSSFLEIISGVGDLSPEGLSAFRIGDQHFLAVANEVSDTTSLYAVAAVPEPSTYALMLAGLLTLGTLARRRRG